ncbi:ComEC/Rec2 family competence protein [Brachyspira pulli]|uniref:ComEC/Rec2 family competence protein n=1 Tax=Brachyspira pulli TaxID=310721 RepID=UPI0030060276
MKKLFIYPLTYIIYITIFFALGISIAFLKKNFDIIYTSSITAFALIMISVILALIRKYNISILILALSSAFIGYNYTMLRYYDIFRNPLNKFNGNIEAYNAKILSYDGVVGFKNRYVAQVNKVYDGTNWHNYAGNIRIYTTSVKPIFINDEITVSSKLDLYKNILTNDTLYDPELLVEILEDKMLYGVANIYQYNNFVVQKEGTSFINYIDNYAIDVRNMVKRALSKNIEAIPYTIIKGIIVGDKNIIPYHIKQYFIDSGISHILSISGLHITMVLTILILLLSFFPINFYKKILIATTITVIVYPPITFFSVSILRASIMALCLMISYYFDRNRNSINALFLAGLIILLFNPSAIKDISFQFSFLATLGIIIYYPVFNFYIIKNIRNIKTNNKAVNIIKSIAIKSLSFMAINIFALITVIPLSIYHFSLLNLTSIVSNIFAVPLAFIILSSSLLTIATYQIYEPLSIYPAKTAEFCSNLLIDLAEKFSNISFLKYELSCNLYLAIFITFIIILIGMILRINVSKLK